VARFFAMSKPYGMRVWVGKFMIPLVNARGPYAKGVAKRREILDAALRVIGEHGYTGATVKQLAEEVGLSQNGLLHYFGSKDELLVEVLRRRDELDALAAAGADLSVAAPDADAVAGGGGAGRTSARSRGTAAHEATLKSATQLMSSSVRRNAQVVGLVQLFARLSADASEAEHAAHAYFADRYGWLHREGSRWMAGLQAAGEIRKDVDPDRIAVMLFSLIDGLQLQWMYDQSVDMGAHVEAFLDLLRPGAEVSSDDADAAARAASSSGLENGGPFLASAPSH